MVGNHKGVSEVVLWQVWIGIFKLLHYFGLRDIYLPLKSAQVASLPEGIDKAVPIGAGGLQAGRHIAEVHGPRCLRDLP